MEWNGSKVLFVEKQLGTYFAAGSGKRGMESTANFQTKNLRIWSLSQTNSSTKEVDSLRARLIS